MMLKEKARRKTGFFFGDGRWYGKSVSSRFEKGQALKSKSLLWAFLLALFAVFCCWYSFTHLLRTNVVGKASGGNSAGNNAVGKSQVVPEQHKFLAATNNGSKRAGLSPQQVPAEARQIAQEYKQIIYPALKQFSAQYSVLPTSGRIPHLKTFMLGGNHKNWHVGTMWRLDGTIISRDVYSKNPPNAPHDPWANNDKYQQVAGTWGQGFIVHGWDDGRVTFDPVSQEYALTISSDSRGQMTTAPPGAAGIPPSAIQAVRSGAGKTSANNQ